MKLSDAIANLREHCNHVIRFINTGDGCNTPGFDVINPLLQRCDAVFTASQGDAPAIGARAAHYGDGVQPWDIIKASGWGPEFAAGNALKYVRRYQNKNGEDDLQKGRWYYHELVEMVTKPSEMWDHAPGVFTKLELQLTQEERALLRLRP